MAANQPCTVCVHPKREEIDQKLLFREETLRSMEKTYSLDKSALSRHRQSHVKKDIVRAMEILNNEERAVYKARSGAELLAALDNLMEKANKIFDDATFSMENPPAPGENGFTTDDIIMFAKTMAKDRSIALQAIREMNNLLGRYGEFIRLGHELRDPNENNINETELPTHVQDLLDAVKAGV